MFDAAERTAGGQKIVLYDRTTGKRFERYAVDAREMLSQYPEAYTLNKAECVKPAEAAPVETAAAAAPPIPAEHSPGVSLKATKSTDAQPAGKLGAPVRSRRSKKS